MSLLTDSELSAIGRNHARVVAIPSQAQTLDMFAEGEQTEELTLCSRAVSTDRQTSILLT